MSHLANQETHNQQSPIIPQESKGDVAISAVNKVRFSYILMQQVWDCSQEATRFTCRGARFQFLCAVSSVVRKKPSLFQHQRNLLPRRETSHLQGYTSQQLHPTVPPQLRSLHRLPSIENFVQLVESILIWLLNREREEPCDTNVTCLLGNSPFPWDSCHTNNACISLERWKAERPKGQSWKHSKGFQAISLGSEPFEKADVVERCEVAHMPNFRHHRRLVDGDYYSGGLVYYATPANEILLTDWTVLATR